MCSMQYIAYCLLFDEFQRVSVGDVAWSTSMPTYVHNVLKQMLLHDAAKRLTRNEMCNRINMSTIQTMDLVS